jgi:hypothetical protein
MWQPIWCAPGRPADDERMLHTPFIDRWNADRPATVLIERLVAEAEEALAGAAGMMVR